MIWICLGGCESLAISWMRGGVVEDEDEVGLRLSNKEESCFYCF
jgi:hypothetical protein